VAPVRTVKLWVKALLPVAPAVLLVVAVLVFYLWPHPHWEGLRRRVPRGPVIAGTALVFAASAFATTRIGHPPSLSPTLDAARQLGVWWWALLIIGLALVVRQRFDLVILLLCTEVLTASAHIAVFGPARLANERIVTFVLVPLACLAAAFALRVDRSSIARPAVPNRRHAMAVALGGVLVVVAVAGAIIQRDPIYTQTSLCCDTSKSVSVIETVADQVRHDTGLPTLIVANEDLGQLSWQKQVDIVDLGWLGDPLFNRLWHARSDVAVGYLNHFAEPDIVEFHGAFSCIYAPWWSSPDFKSSYHQVYDDGISTNYAETVCPKNGPNIPGGIWVRNDLSNPSGNREIELSRRLAEHPDPQLVADELQHCKGADPWDCEYVTRAVYRDLPALDRAGVLPELAALFRTEPTGPYDVAVINSRSRGDWYKAAVDFLVRHPNVTH
jgi:hypothetical protein